MYIKNVKYNKNKKIKRKSRVTVCIAAINNGVILGASDRMVTGGYGDITFEPPTSKILTLSNSIAVLTAGDQSIQMQVYQKANKIIGDRIIADRDKWINVSYAVEVYSQCFFDLRKRMIENHVLSPNGLTYDSYILKQKSMDGDFIIKIKNEINEFINYMESIQTIIAGIDDTGAHIYVVEDGEISCHDKMGFAAIGIGRYHSISHFMFSKYAPNISPPKALLTIHQAKKKAEVSPGVGEVTDMCIILGKGGFKTITKPPFVKDIVQDLDEFYKDYKEEIRKIDEDTENKIGDYLENMVSIKPSEQTESTSPSASPSDEAKSDDEQKNKGKN